MRRKYVAIVLSVLMTFSGMGMLQETVYAQEEQLMFQTEDVAEEETVSEEESKILTEDLEVEEEETDGEICEDGGVDTGFLDDGEFLIEPEEGSADEEEDGTDTTQGTFPEEVEQNHQEGEGVTETESGSCGEGVTYTLYNDGTLIITGTGVVSETDTFSENSEIKNIVAENGVTGIAAYAFSRCKNLTSVELPESMTEIPEGIFYACDQLQSVTFKGEVTTIAAKAFSGCLNLTGLALPESLRSIGQEAFSGAESIGTAQQKKITLSLPEGLQSIGEGAFTGCKFTNINLPGSVTEFGDRVFQNCEKLTDITIPEHFTVIKEGTFLGCSSLSSVKLSQNLKKIENNAFCGCSSLKTIEIPESVTELGAGVFQHCTSLDSITLPSQMTIIPADTFLGCSSLKKLVIPSRVTRLGTGAFQLCTKLESIVIPERVTVMEEGVFLGCSSLKNMEIPAGVAEIGPDVFYRCGNLSSIQVKGSTTEIKERAIGYTRVKNGNEWKDVKIENVVISGNAGSKAELYAVKNGITFLHAANTLTYHPSVKASCEQNGNIEYWHCSGCNQNFSDADGLQKITTEIILPKGHILEKQNEKKATSKAKGVKAYYLCSKCHKKFLDAKGTREATNQDLVIPQITQEEEIVERETEVKTPAVTKPAKKTESVKIKTQKITGLKKSVSVVKGKTIRLKPVLVPKNSTDKITYSSSNKKIAAVSAKGIITGKKAGTAKITVKSGSKKVTVTVKVTKVKTTKLSAVPTKKTIKKGKTFRIKATVTPKNSDEKVTYSSSNKKIATVTSGGVVKGRKKGKVTITVKSGSRKKTCKVTVK